MIVITRAMNAKYLWRIQTEQNQSSTNQYERANISQNDEEVEFRAPDLSQA